MKIGGIWKSVYSELVRVKKRAKLNLQGQSVKGRQNHQQEEDPLHLDRQGLRDPRDHRDHQEDHLGLRH